MQVPSTLPSTTVDQVLDLWPVARLATSGPNGPHIVPVVFARGVDVLWSPIDGKPKRGGPLQRVKNVMLEPRAAVLIDAWDSDWSRLWWLRVDVTASVVNIGSNPDAETVAAVAALEAKYPQYQEIPVLGEPPMLLRLAIQNTQSWCASAGAIASIESFAHSK